MQKWVLNFLSGAVLITLFVSTDANAIIGFGANTAQQPAAAPASGPLSPDQFKSLVKTLHQQSQSEFNKQRSQDLAKSPPASTTTPTTPTTSGTSTPTVATPSPTLSTPSVNSSAPIPTMSGSAPAAASTPPPNYGSQAPQTSVYTGFGPSNQGSTTTPAKPASGGWNIQY